MVFTQAETGGSMKDLLKIEAEVIDTKDYKNYFVFINKSSVEEIARSLRVSDTAIRDIINELWLDLLEIGFMIRGEDTIYLNDKQIEAVASHIKRSLTTNSKETK